MEARGGQGHAGHPARLGGALVRVRLLRRAHCGGRDRGASRWLRRERRAGGGEHLYRGFCGPGHVAAAVRSGVCRAGPHRNHVRLQWHAHSGGRSRQAQARRGIPTRRRPRVRPSHRLPCQGRVRWHQQHRAARVPQPCFELVGSCGRGHRDGRDSPGHGHSSLHARAVRGVHGGHGHAAHQGDPRGGGQGSDRQVRHRLRFHVD
mmetsp:Transcript_14322/g.43539  ORF Transcript_14322/g.43539 Transcript_14322/m.43539 type:complete len:205 (-) Transcript_14322:655-1269(-)